MVDVIRISPQDAPSIIDEKAGQRKKLLGTKFGNFGAFFDQSWRENDMLWGRLDGAESLINAVLPEDNQFKQDLLLQAHEAILVEDFLPKFQETAGKEGAFPSPGIGNGRSALVDKFKEYQIEGVYPREQMWKLAARVAPVLAMMLHSMEGRRKYLRVFAIWITRLGKFFNAILSVIDWLRFPWRARKPAAQREKVLTQPSLR